MFHDWLAKVCSATTRWMEPGSSPRSLKTRPAFSMATVILRPAGMVTHLFLDLLQEHRIFLAKCLCHHQSTPGTLISPTSSSSALWWSAERHLHQTFCSPETGLWALDQRWHFSPGATYRPQGEAGIVFKSPLSMVTLSFPLVRPVTTLSHVSTFSLT